MMRTATSARLAAAVLAATAASHAPGSVHTWQGPGGTTATPTSGNWNDAANWEGGLPAFGDTTKDIRFSASAGNDGAGALAANFDFGGGFGLPYQFAQLRFNNTSATEQTIAGNQITASFMTSEILQNGPGDWRILAPLYHYGDANNTLKFTGSGSGILHIGQHGSDTVGKLDVFNFNLVINNTGGGGVALYARNTYTTETVVQAGRLILGRDSTPIGRRGTRETSRTALRRDPAVKFPQVCVRCLAATKGRKVIAIAYHVLPIGFCNASQRDLRQQVRFLSQSAPGAQRHRTDIAAHVTLSPDACLRRARRARRRCSLELASAGCVGLGGTLFVRAGIACDGAITISTMIAALARTRHPRGARRVLDLAKTNPAARAGGDLAKQTRRRAPRARFGQNKPGGARRRRSGETNPAARAAKATWRNKPAGARRGNDSGGTNPFWRPVSELGQDHRHCTRQ